MPVTTFVDGAVISAAEHNANWDLAVLTDTARTITVTHTFSAAQTFTGGWTAGAACSINSSGGAAAFTINATTRLYLDGVAGVGGNTFIEESSADLVGIVTGGTLRASIGASGLVLAAGISATTGTFSGVISRSTASQSVNNGNATTPVTLPAGLFLLTGTVDGTAASFSALLNPGASASTAVVALANINPQFSGSDFSIQNSTGGTKTINYNLIRLL